MHTAENSDETTPDLFGDVPAEAPKPKKVAPKKTAKSIEHPTAPVGPVRPFRFIRESKDVSWMLHD